MKKRTSFGWWRALHLVDRLLLIFMTILLVQSAHNLFFHELAAEDSATLDVVIRTTAAAIFGYFISAGFRGASEQNAVSAQNAIGFVSGSDTPNAPTARIGFAAETQTDETPMQSGSARGSSTPALNRRTRQQLIIVAIIGISSLLLLVIARNYAQPSAASVATLSQLRDFVSGSVGFLIGHAGGAER